MSEEWGPWIDHDGKGCPVSVGTMVRVDIPALGVIDSVAGCGDSASGYCYNHGRQNEAGVSHWVGEMGDPFVIVRYRIRKPRGLTILESIAKEPEVEPA